jgi:tripartite-type tricarboxylate transporter receptor subunit TctC
MRLPRRTFLRAAVGAAALPALARTVWAQTYPSRPVKLVVCYAAGGTGDIVGRLIGAKLAVTLGQSVVVENRPGASGAIGTKEVIDAAPDGHTVLVGQTGEIVINPHWTKDIGYDPDKDLMPIALAAVVPLALVVPASASYTTVAGMLQAAKERSLTFASAGSATPGRFAGEMLKVRTKTNLIHVPYGGAGPALNDLLGGHVDMFFSGFPAALPQVKAGALKLLAVSSHERSAAAPDVPTVAEAAAIPDFDFSLWAGFFARRGTPESIVVRLNTEINKILATDDIKQKLLQQGANVSPISIAQFGSFVKAESEKYRRLIKDANLTPPA